MGLFCEGLFSGYMNSLWFYWEKKKSMKKTGILTMYPYMTENQEKPCNKAGIPVLIGHRPHENAAQKQRSVWLGSNTLPG